MEGFVADLERAGEKHRPEKFSDFRDTLAEVARHPNRRYFTLKTIILNNLFGVDIMEEAVEICKLRLFLKLVAQVERGEEIEPLPDIDFNIRAGNTLVGYANYDEAQKAVTSKLQFDDAMARIDENAEIADRAFKRFREMQTVREMDAKRFAESKQELRRRLKDLDDELDRYLAGEYAVNPDKAKDFEKWRASHQPFHWFVEFYGIIKSGGFDVIIGNPPYVELNVLGEYRLLEYTCSDAGNLYALVIERCFDLLFEGGRQGFIVPVSSVSTDRYNSLQRLIVKHDLYYSSFDDRPSRLFDGLEHIRLTIHLMSKSPSRHRLFSTRYNKWNASERAALFDNLVYAPAELSLIDGSLPKLSSNVEASIIRKLISEKSSLASFYARGSDFKIYYSRKVGYFLQALDFEPTVLDGRGHRRPPSEFKSLCFSNEHHAQIALCCLNANLFYWFITVFSDCRHVNKREVDGFLIDLQKLAKGEQSSPLMKLAKALMSDLKKNSELRKMKFKHDALTVQCIMPKQSKPIIDEIDRVLAKHYSFTDEELDFIINYDIKYRMGRNAGEEEE